MPIEFINDPVREAAPGSSPFERMQQMSSDADHNLVTVDVTGFESEAVRFDRAEVDGKPGVVMQERGSTGVWQEGWSWAAQSADAREGMIGWLNTQSDRWDRFARMLHRRGPEELTAWIFELMVVPSIADARPPRLEPQQWTTIDQYDTPSFLRSVRSSGHQSTRPSLAQRARSVLDDCTCRSPGVQHSRNF